MDQLSFGCAQAIGGARSVPRNRAVFRVLQQVTLAQVVPLVWILRGTAVRLTADVILDGRLSWDSLTCASIFARQIEAPNVPGRCDEGGCEPRASLMLRLRRRTSATWQILREGLA